MGELESFWAARFGAMAPLGFRLRASLPNRWVRVHSLPHAQRYAREESERAEVLRRMNAVAEAALGVECWLIAAAAELGPGHALDELPGLTLEDRLIAADAEVWDGAPVAYRGVRVRWQRGAFDTLLEAIADDARCALFTSVDTGAVFAPYDGGADLIAPSPEVRDALRETFAAWLSSRPDGL